MKLKWYENQVEAEHTANVRRFKGHIGQGHFGHIYACTPKGKRIYYGSLIDRRQASYFCINPRLGFKLTKDGRLYARDRHQILAFVKRHETSDNP